MARRALQKLGAWLAHPDLPWASVCLVALAFGAWLRARDLGSPRVMSFDEHHFVVNARRYLEHASDLNDHPPLGKLVFGVAMRWLGDEPKGWRFAPLCFGYANVILVGLLSHWATGRKSAFYIGAFLAALDGFLISYSRCALLDGMLTALCLASAWVALRARSPLGTLLSALVVGSACAIKFSAVVLIPLLFVVALLRRRWFGALGFLLIVPAVYTAWFAFGLSIARQPHDVLAVWAETKRLYLHHAALTDWKHPLLSHWYEWFLPKRPLPLRFEPLGDGRFRVLTSLGNPLLWWMVDAAVAFTLVHGLVASALWLVRKKAAFGAALAGLLERPGVRRFVLFCLWCGPVAPWLISRRDSYIYHYLPAYAAGITLVAALIDTLRERARLPAFVLLLVLGQVSFYYAPVWGQLPISREGFHDRLFIERWR